MYNEFTMSTSDCTSTLEPLAGLQDKLDFLIAQIEAYERALPAANHAARAALGDVRRLAKQALNEARSLQDALMPPETSEHPLTPRENEVLFLAARGLTNKEIAYRLGISERTVQFHMNSIFNKTATSSRTGAVVLAINHGWITPP